MKIAFMHYHLKTGGVTTVIKRQIAAIQGVCESLVITGDRAYAELPCDIVELPELDYDRANASPPDSDQVTQRVLDALFKRWPGGCDILHVHNPTLAKNRQGLQIIKRLQQAGVILFLQIHDFAEDGRPDLYYQEAYPADCHYGVINLRDMRILLGAGLVPSGLHHIPNAVDGPTTQSSRTNQPLILYPVRAIRRKNLGEAILLSLFLNDGQRLAVTQPPNSPADAVSYRDWVRWVREYRLRVEFEAGKKQAFQSLVGCSESMITTSIAEGFGLAFLEPWTAGKLLWGRRLDNICEEFEKNGLCLDSLYNRLVVPLEWIDRDRFTDQWHLAVFSALKHYDHALPDDTVTKAFARLSCDGKMDFGMLSEKFQRQVLERLIADTASRTELTLLNPWLSNLGVVADPSALIENNRQAALQHYGVNQYRNRLLTIYNQILCHPVCQHIDKAAVVDRFFDLNRFSLLKWSGYDG